jgi:hypothetical protein
MGGDQTAMQRIAIVSRQSVFVGFDFGAGRAGKRYGSDENMFDHGSLDLFSVSLPRLCHRGFFALEFV